MSDMPRDSQNKTSDSTDEFVDARGAPVEPGANAVKMAGESPAGHAPVMIVPHAKQAELPQSDPGAPTPVQLAAAEPPRTSKMAAIIVALTVLAIVGLSLWYLVQPQPLLVQGEADATRVDIAARIDGRVGQRPVSRGDNVTAGQLLVAIDNPELLTKLHEAEAARVVAAGGPHAHRGRHARRGGCGTQGCGRGSGGQRDACPADLRPGQAGHQGRLRVGREARRGDRIARRGDANFGAGKARLSGSCRWLHR